jgi:hypothetical protein
VKKPSRDPSTLPQTSPEAISARLEEMERKVDRLRSMYETFFSGLERRAPDAPRRELNRLMLEMQQQQIRNVALRFRFQSLSQKWTLMTTYWNRTLREIEAGTYRKDVARVSRRLAQKGAPLTEAEAIALGIPAARARALVARQANAAGAAAATATAAAPPQGPGATGLPPAGAAAAPPEAAPAPTARAAPPPGIPGMTEEDLLALHQRYGEAARATGRAAPSLDRLRAQLTRHVPEVMAQLGTPDVTFDVAVKDGRVVLRPKPRPKR